MATGDIPKTLLKKERRPGDLVFAIFFLALSIFLLSQIGGETKWVKGTKLFAQPAFWPGVGLIGMCVFAAGHCIGSLRSVKTAGRNQELLLWLKSVEYALWFMAYVWIVPVIGYLPATLLFVLTLTIRIGYRGRRTLFSGLLMGAAIVLIFKGLLSVKIPGGQLYEYLPDGLRNFMLLYL